MPPPLVAQGARLDAAVRGAGLTDYIYRTLRGESPPRAEFLLPLGRDQTRWVEISGAPLSATPDGQKLCLFVLHDITRLKDLENVRKQLQEVAKLDFRVVHPDSRQMIAAIEANARIGASRTWKMCAKNLSPMFPTNCVRP